MLERLTLVLINILFPPIAVYYLTGFGTDLLVNCFLFLLAIVPAHVHVSDDSYTNSSDN